MPRETVFRGKKSVWVEHPQDGTTHAWTEHLEYKYPVLNPGDTDFKDQNPEGSIIVNGPELEVSWSKPGEWTPEDEDGFVQVSINVDRNEILRIAKELEENPTITMSAFYTSGIPRTKLNELVRVVKRARNAAFGTDE